MHEFLAVSQDHVCGNGQRNTAFWDRITTNYNHNKPRSCPVRPARSLESKWSHIKHDVAKFTGVFKQISDCRESGASAEDVLERALEYYKDRHPKHQALHFYIVGIFLRRCRGGGSRLRKYNVGVVEESGLWRLAWRLAPLLQRNRVVAVAMLEKQPRMRSCKSWLSRIFRHGPHDPKATRPPRRTCPTITGGIPSSRPKL